MLCQLFAVPLISAIILSAVEIFWLSLGHHEANGVFTNLWYILPIAICWFPILFSIRVIGNLKYIRKNNFLSIFQFITSVLFLFIILILTISSWYFYIRTGKFLSIHQLQFGLDNLAALQLHFFQTASSIWLLFTICAFTMAVALTAVLTRWNPSLGRVSVLCVNTCLVIFTVALGIVIASALLNKEKPKPLHPLISYLMPSNDVLILKDTSIKMPTLKLRTAEASDTSILTVQNPVIVIMVESMRWDLIQQTPCPVPFMASLISQGWFFERAYAPASHSNYADLSIWYSRYPLWAERKPRYRKNDPYRSESIFKVFQDLGYRTAYISSQNEKWGGMIRWLEVPEIDHFFHSEDYDGKTWVNEDDRAGLAQLLKINLVTAGKMEDSQTLRISLNWIDTLPVDQQFFLGINLQNTHFNYVIPAGGEEPFQPTKMDFPAIYYAWPRDRVEDVRNRYFNAFFNLDQLISSFSEDLNLRGIWDNCWFVIIGDSGEGFYEHDFANHSGPMYDEAIRTFCLIKPPAGKPVGKVSRAVNLIDILPALLDLMGLPIPNDFQGVSPFKEETKRPVYLHSRALVTQDGIIDWPWKLLVTHSPSKRIELYDLDQDPAEKSNLYSVHADLASELLLNLEHWRKVQLQYTGYRSLHKNYYPPRYIDEENPVAR